MVDSASSSPKDGSPAGQPPETSDRERLELYRGWMTLLRDILLAALILFCILRPNVVASWLSELGVSEASLFGVKLTPGGKRELANSIDALRQQRDAALFERNTLARANSEAVKELERLRQQLPQQQKALLNQTIEAVRRETQSVSASPAQPSQVQAELVQQAREAVGSSGQWAVVFGGDPTLKAATDELSWARDNGLRNAAIVRRQNSFRSVALAGSAEEADKLLPIARRRRGDAYVVNLDRWCQNPVDRDGYRECEPGA